MNFYYKSIVRKIVHLVWFIWIPYGLSLSLWFSLRFTHWDHILIELAQTNSPRLNWQCHHCGCVIESPILRIRNVIHFQLQPCYFHANDLPAGISTKEIGDSENNFGSINNK